MNITKFNKIFDLLIEEYRILPPFRLANGWILMRAKDNTKPKKHQCSYCKKDHETEMFIGYNGSVLWFGRKCLTKMKRKLHKRKE